MFSLKRLLFTQGANQTGIASQLGKVYGRLARKGTPRTAQHSLTYPLTWTYKQDYDVPRHRGPSLASIMPSETDADSKHLTELLVRWSQGDKGAFQSLIPVVYNELRKLAHNHLKREQHRETVQTASLVHEAYLRMAKYSPRALGDRKQFFAMASGIMRQVLVDRARKKQARKRDAGIKLELAPEMMPTSSRELDLLELDEALGQLQNLDARQGRIVELRFFAGLSIEQTAEVLDMSPSTVTRDWITARAWLQRRILHKREAHAGGGRV